MHAPTTYTAAQEVPWYKRNLWMLPLLMAITFVGFIAYWAENKDAIERLAYQRTLLADMQSVETQLTGRQEFERTKLQEVANKLSSSPNINNITLRSLPEVVAGLDRLWDRLVFLNEDRQIIALATRSSVVQSKSEDGLKIQTQGQAEHFVVPVNLAGKKSARQLIARYELTDLLQSTDLGWLNRRYQVDFLSELGEVIATTEIPGKVPLGQASEQSLPSFKNATLRLTPFDAPVSWRSNGRTIALLAGIVLIGSAASQLLRKQMAQVTRAVTISQTEASWRQSMEDSALVGLRARDPSGRILYVNKTLCNMVGYSSVELVGLIPPLPFWPPEAVDDMMARNLNTLAGQGPTNGFESQWKHRDGRMVDVMVFESPLINPKGVQIGWMGSIVDISERKKLEEKERRHVEAMAQHARLNDVGLIASELAHELNQPLTSIASYSAGLDIALKKRLPNDTELLNAVSAVHRSAKKAGDIVNWIRRQSSRTESVRLECNINALVAESLEQRKRQIKSNSVQVNLNLAADLPPVAVDRIGIEQVIANLVKNAIDAMEFQDNERSIWILSKFNPTSRGNAGCIELTVRDKGPGLQGRTIDTLSSTFYSTKASGMGLGLGICCAIIDSHGGKVSALDAPDGGAEFSFTIPISNVIS